MIISHKHKFIFFRPNGKCGTTTIENALKEYHEGPQSYLESQKSTNLMHISPRHFFLNPAHYKFMNYRKIAVVRNPYDWYLSLHRHAIKKHNDEISSYEESHDVYYSPTEYTWDSPQGSFNMKRINEVLTVVSLAAYLWENQFCCLCYRGKLMADTVLKFENLQNDFDALMDSLNLPRKKLGHSRKKTNYDKWKPYQYYYSHDGMIAVEALCDFDFNAFSYKKESVAK